MALTIMIEKTDNGFILRGDEGVNVYEESEDCESDVDVEAVRKLLCGLVEMLGASGSRYDAKRTSVTTEPGDKFEGPAGTEDQA